MTYNILCLKRQAQAMCSYYSVIFNSKSEPTPFLSFYDIDVYIPDILTKGITVEFGKGK